MLFRSVRKTKQRKEAFNISAKRRRIHGMYFLSVQRNGDKKRHLTISYFLYMHKRMKHLKENSIEALIFERRIRSVVVIAVFKRV